MVAVVVMVVFIATGFFHGAVCSCSLVNACPVGCWLVRFARKLNNKYFCIFKIFFQCMLLFHIIVLHFSGYHFLMA